MNKIFRKVWSKSLGQLVVASELASSASGTPTTKGRGFRASTLPIAAAIACVLAGTHAPSAQAASINLSGTCLTGVINTVVGRIIAGATLGQATDGNSSYSSVAGCSANGNNQTAVTVFGSHSSATALGGSAMGFNATAARFASSIGIESRATGSGSAAPASSGKPSPVAEMHKGL